MIRLVALHEIGHQFELSHNGTFLQHIMEVHSNAVEEGQIPDMQPLFSEQDLDQIRKHGGSGGGSFPQP